MTNITEKVFATFEALATGVIYLVVFATFLTFFLGISYGVFMIIKLLTQAIF